MSELDPPPEALLIERLRTAMRPKLSIRNAAEKAGISDARWRQIAKGHNQASSRVRVPARAPDDTLARMAHVVGATPAQLREAGRDEAAYELERLLTANEPTAAAAAEPPDESREYLQSVIGQQQVARPRGAWELGPDLMVELALATDNAEFMAATSNHGEDDDIEDVISDLESLVDAVNELVEVATTVAELGVGGKAHLAIAKEREIQRRKEAREAMRRRAAELGRRLSTRQQQVQPKPSAQEHQSSGDVHADQASTSSPAPTQGSKDTQGEDQKIGLAERKADEARTARRGNLGRQPTDTPATEVRSQ